MTAALVLLAVLLLAYANGANDNFKGVATLFGSGLANYRGALLWATAATLAGSLAAVALAATLLARFGGKGLVPDDLVAQPAYAAAVALGAAATVLLATRCGLPISTTHALVGALVGAGWAAGAGVNVGGLGKLFLLPLLVSPVLSLVVTLIGSGVVRLAAGRSGDSACVCVGTEPAAPLPAGSSASVAQPGVRVGRLSACRRVLTGGVIDLTAGLTDRLHFLSAGAVSFARGLNDAPKIAALLLVLPAATAWLGVAAVAVVMAVGGLISAKRVAETMSHRITPITPGGGLAANLATASIVLSASWFGLPVSTTHVSCGALFGLAVASRGGRPDVIGTVLAAWLTTLPLGAACGAACGLLLT